MSERARRAAPNGDSGLLLLAENDAALRWRLAMIDSAQRSIDLQTYVWKGDAGRHRS
jgi:phosphatidylserine/phosphatidylglycerophosphate/cardiolipin synthase-like enzyme